MSPSVISLLVIVCALTAVTCDVNWMTPINSAWTFECPDGHDLRILQSASIPYTHDRQWTFTCSDDHPALINASCEWSAYVNDFNQMFNFQCPDEGVVTGVAAYHGGNVDRWFQFRCCFPEGYIAHACVFTPDLNSLGGFMNYRVQERWYIRGFSSQFYQMPNGYYDRVFSLNVCKVNKLSPT